MYSSNNSEQRFHRLMLVREVISLNDFKVSCLEYKENQITKILS